MSDKPIIRYKCPVCGTHFNKKAECLEHMRLHRKEKLLCKVCLNLYADGWRFWNITRRVHNTVKAEGVVIQELSSWTCEVENNPTSILDAKKRLKADALRYFRGQAKLIAKLETEEDSNESHT